MCAGRRRSYFERYGAPSAGHGPGRLDELIALQRGVVGSRLHMIASACYPFDSVLRALAEPSFVLPAEGMPGERYLPGAAVMDDVERDGAELALALFGSPGGYEATIQPHSGTQANQVVYNAVLRPDDKVLCLRPKNGGHISHTVLLSRRHKTIGYGLNDEAAIDYDQMRALAREHRPRLIIVGGSSLPRAVEFEVCAQIAKESGALLHADVSHTATFIAAGLHHEVFPHCDFVTFNTVKNLRGPNGGVLIHRHEYAARVATGFFPTTQGGANETGMLGKLACLAEWHERDLKAYASRIVECSAAVGAQLQRRGIPLVSGGSDCHMLLVDLKDLETSGAEIERRLEAGGVLANRNLVPGDRRSPMETSGIRLGTTNLAILGYADDDLALLGGWVADLTLDDAPDDRLVPDLVSRYQGHLVAPVW